MYVREDATCISISNKDGDLRQREDRPVLSSQKSLDGSHSRIHRLKSGHEPQEGLDTSKDWMTNRHLYSHWFCLHRVTMTCFSSYWTTSPSPNTNENRSPSIKTESCASLALLCDHRRIEGWVYKLIGQKGRWQYWRITKVYSYRHL
jgi:hypothetical protein